jgi:WD40 repeat protein
VAVELPAVSLPSSAAISPDGRYLATASADIHIWELPSGRQLLSLEEVGSSNVSFAFSPDGRHLAAAWNVGTQLWELPEGRKVLSLKGGNCVAFSPDGGLLATGGIGPWGLRGGREGIGVWEFPGGGQVLALNVEHSDVVFSPDGRLLAAGRLRNTARVWELRSGREVCAVRHVGLGFLNSIDQVAFSADGRYLATTAGKAVRLWKLPDGLHAQSIGDQGIKRFAFSPDGRYVVTSGYSDEAARVWELSSGQEIARVNHAGVNDAAFSPDGRLLVTAGNHMVRVWQVSLEARA